MKKANVSDLEKGTIFEVHGDLFKVVSREEYPFIECKHLDGPSKYEHNVLFGGNQEIVNVIKGGIIHMKFKQIGPNFFRLTIDKVEKVN